MRFLYPAWNQKCSCEWLYTDHNITDLNGNPVEGTILISLSDRCIKHKNILKYLVKHCNAPSNRCSVELLRELEYREKDNNLFPKTNRFDLILERM